MHAAFPMLRYLRMAPEESEPRPGLLVDRDGVLNRRMVGGYVLDPAELHFLDAVVPALALASRRGVPVAVVTNQGCVSQGLLSEAGLLAIHAGLVDHLASHGVVVDGIYACPHHPAAVEPEDRDCDCRKPRPGLLTAAARDLHLDLARSVFIGDQETDRHAASAAGVAPERFWLVDPATMAERDAAATVDGITSALGIPQA